MDGHLLLTVLCLLLISPGDILAGKGKGKQNNDGTFDCSTAKCVRKFLRQYNVTGTRYLKDSNIAYWNYATDLIPTNGAKNTDASVASSNWFVEQTDIARRIASKNIKGLKAVEERLLKKIASTASSRNQTVGKLLSQALNKMSSTYGTATVEVNGKKLEEGETGVKSVFSKSRNCSELRSVWKQWRDGTGRKYRSEYAQFVKLLNIGARENNYKDYGYYEFFSDTEDPHFDETVMVLYHKVLPLYKELHAYVRHKLKSFYPDCMSETGPIPAHLLGNVWGQEWSGIIDIVKPYPKAMSLDITDEMKRQGWTVDKLFQTAESFFVSLGLYNMTDKFWQRSMFTKPKDRSVNCHPSAYDLYTYDDFRIQMCAQVTGKYLEIIHHEMGHIIYNMCYRNQPVTFRDGANDGFHEAIGDTISIAVTTPQHLRKLNLVKGVGNSKETDINSLMQMALTKVAFLPYALTLDTWRWRAFNGSISTKDYNKEWWKLRKDFQGLKPPVARSEEDFDPGAKYHVAQGMTYIPYFASHVLQFQFYEAMCKLSGHKGPLHQCDFYGSKKAGKSLKKMLALGSSKPWPEAMKVLTGQPHMLLDSLVRYFEPLQVWLKDFRQSKGYPIGWD